jgi:hypothetical protein
MPDVADNRPHLVPFRSHARLVLGLLLPLHLVACCLSLIYVAELYATYQLVVFNKTHIFMASLNVVLFAAASILFTLGRFSFGYFLGFYFYTMTFGYLWLVAFSKFPYNHTLAAASAFASALAFLVPALFITSPIKQRFVLSSARALDNLLSAILVLAVAVIAAGAANSFRLASLADIYHLREGIDLPAWLRYAIGVTSNALLPFAFACFVALENRLRAASALLLLLLFYPITLTKLALFAPFWLLFLALMSRFFEARICVVLSLFLPISAGIILVLLFKSGALSLEHMISLFGAINFRMIALPSVALDIYNDFFSTHHLTYFCQISVLKPFVDCPYADQLSIVMQNAYRIGNFNASLFATEGIASVGMTLAPLAALACGLVISFVNRLSSGLPSKFILLSGGILPQIFLNVPLATSLLTNGAALLFLLWYVTPRVMFKQEASELSLLRIDRPEGAQDT